MDLFLIDVVEETMPRTTLMLVVMLLCALLGAHAVRANQIIAGRGTVQHIDAEGGSLVSFRINRITERIFLIRFLCHFDFDSMDYISGFLCSCSPTGAVFTVGESLYSS